MNFDNMKKDKDFQKWCFDTDLVGNKNWFNLENGSGDEVYIAYEAWVAGQQSKQEEVNKLQEEVDALKAKIDDLVKWTEFHIEDYNLSESESEHDRGWFNAACQVFKTLKDNKNDT